MSNDVSKLSFQQDQTAQTTASLRTGHEQKVREFASAEAVIRADKEGIEAPPEVAARLHESISKEPPARVPWWRKIFGGKP